MFKNIVFFNAISEVLVREAEMIKTTEFDETVERSTFVVTYDDRNSVNDILYCWMSNVNKYIMVSKMGELWCYFDDHCSMTLVPNGGFDTDMLVHNGYLVSEADDTINKDTFVKCFNHHRFIDIYINMCYEEYINKERSSSIIFDILTLTDYMMENYDFGIINVYCYDFEKSRYVLTKGGKVYD